MRSSNFSLVFLSFSCLSAFGAADDAAASRVRQALAQRIPDVKIQSVAASPVAGLYEVITADGIYYADAAGDHLIMGQILDTASKRNLSVDRWNELNSIDFSKLPLELAIKRVQGDGHRRLALFADPDCPYCRTLEKDLQSVPDVTIYTFLFPLEQIHPGSRLKAQQLWCAQDQAGAWTDWMLNQKIQHVTPCEDTVDATYKLGNALKVDSTPTLFFSNGRRVAGVIPADQLRQLLDESETKTARVK